MSTNLSEINVLSKYMSSINSAIDPRGPYNKEIWITTSGDWVAPVTGYYDIWAIGGGSGGYVYLRATDNYRELMGGTSGSYVYSIMKFNAGDIVPVTIGSGGIGQLGTLNNSVRWGGDTKFGSLVANGGSFCGKSSGVTFLSSMIALYMTSYGGGIGGPGETMSTKFYGSGGAASVTDKKTSYAIVNGKSGAVRIRYNDPTADSAFITDME